MDGSVLSSARQRVKSHRDQIYQDYMVGVDPWLGHDKLEHVVACFAITIMIHMACAHVNPYSIRMLYAMGGGALAGIAKEVGDAVRAWPWCRARRCSASGRDLVADVVGILAALVGIGLFSCCAHLGRMGRGYKTVPRALAEDDLAEQGASRNRKDAHA